MCQRNIDRLPLTHSQLPPTGGPCLQPSTCPDWNLNRRPFSLQDDDQPTEPHNQGPLFFRYNHLALRVWEEKGKQEVLEHSLLFIPTFAFCVFSTHMEVGQALNRTRK